MSRESVDLYKCEGGNLYGRDEKDFLVRIKDPAVGKDKEKAGSERKGWECR